MKHPHMKHPHPSLILVPVLAAFQLTAYSQTSAAADKVETAKVDKVAVRVDPAKLEKIEGTELNRVTLSEKAAQRLGIQTAPVREEQVNGAQRKLIPYAAVIYDLKGNTWAYTNPKPLTFTRQPIVVDYIDDDTAVLVDGPAVGTEVATVGVAELYGADTGIGK